MEKSVPSLSSIFVSLLKNITGTCFFPYRLHFKETYPDHLIQNFNPPNTFKGLLWWLSGKEPACNDPRVGKIPWRREWQLTPVFLPGESHGQRSLAGYSSWGCKRAMRYCLVSKQNSQAVHHVLFSLIIDLTPC